MCILKLKKAYCKLTPSSRLYKLELPVIGLTGGIACGKSSAADFFRSEGVPVIDADKLVKDIYRETETIHLVKKLDPTVFDKDQINFKRLRISFFSTPHIKKEIENYIYKKLPLYFSYELKRVTKRYKKASFIVYEVPLLFENKIQNLFDLTLCIYTNEHVQKARLLKRDQTSSELVDKILLSQYPVDIKSQMADFAIDNSSNLPKFKLKLESFLNKVAK